MGSVLEWLLLRLMQLRAHGSHKPHGDFVRTSQYYRVFEAKSLLIISSSRGLRRKCPGSVKPLELARARLAAWFYVRSFLGCPRLIDRRCAILFHAPFARCSSVPYNLFAGPLAPF